MLLGFVFCTLFLWREKTSKALLFRGQRGGFLKFPTQCGGSTKWLPAEQIQNVFLFFVYLVGATEFWCFKVFPDC